MESQARSTQTAFRFRPDLLRRLKNRARLENKSLNAFVEEALERTLGPDEDPRKRILEEIKSRRNPLVPLKELMKYNLGDNDKYYDALKDQYFNEKYGL